MSIPSRVWTGINCQWSELLFPGVTITDPLADQVLNHPVAEEKGEYTGEGEEPPEDGFWHLNAHLPQHRLIPGKGVQPSLLFSLTTTPTANSFSTENGLGRRATITLHYRP